MNDVEIMLSILIIVVLLNLIFRPKLDKTRDGKWLLWYNAGRSKRSYIELN